MKKVAAAAAILLLTGCATVSVKQAPQVNRAAKADKYAAPKQSAPAPMPTPNQVVKKRWYGGVKVVATAFR